MSSQTVTEEALTEARGVLADFAIERATSISEQVGFGWRASPDAPVSYDEMLTEFATCTVTGEDFRVQRPNAIPSVFGSARATFAACFWDAATRIELEAPDGFYGNMAVAKAQLQQLLEAGQPEGLVPWRLLRADTVGQTYVAAMTSGGQVRDRLAFATTAVTVGLPMAVLSAVEQIEGRPISGQDTEAFLKFMRAEL